jgi:hypothetical protein
MFCALGLIFGGTEVVGSRFPVFALPDSFSAVPRAFNPVFKFSAPGHIFGGNEGVGSHFIVLRSMTRFRRYQGCRVPFSCFTLSDSFSAVPRASGPIFKFCALELILGGIECFGYRYHVLRARNRFRRYGGRRVCFQDLGSWTRFWLYRGRLIPFSCLALSYSFSMVPGESILVFLFCVSGLIFGGTEGVGSRFHVLRSQTYFRWYRGRRVPFSFFARPDSFSAVPRASFPVFLFFAPGLVFGGAECIASCFHVLRAWILFRRYRGRRVPFSYSALPDSFSAVPRVSGYLFMFCAPGHILGGTEGVGSRFHVLCSQTQFRRYRGRRVPFSYFALPD